MGKEPGTISEIRAMREDDLQRIIEIDNLVLGERRPDYWEGKTEIGGTGLFFNFSMPWDLKEAT